MKKIISLLTALVLLMGVCVMPASAADGSITITPAAETVAVDGTLKFDVVLSGTIGYVEMTVAWDAADFTYVADSFVAATDDGEDIGIYSDSLTDNSFAIKYKEFSNIKNMTLASFELKACSAAALGDAANKDANVTATYLQGSTSGGMQDMIYDKDGGLLDITLVPAAVKIVKPHEAPVVTAAISGDAIVGKTLTASATFTDNWNITEGTKTYAWFIDGAEVATGETYVVKAADYGKAITAKATVTVEADENTTGVGEATTAAVAYDAEAKASISTPALPDVIAVGVPVEVSYDFTASINGGNDASTVAWTDKGGKELKGTVDGNKYTPALEDFTNGVILVATITVKGEFDTATDTATAEAKAAVVAGNMTPVISNLKVMNGETELTVAPVVGDVLTVAYDWSDVAEVGGPDESTTDASVVTWTIGEGEDAEVVEAAEYEVKASDIGKAIKVVVDAVSTDATPNTNLGLDAEAVVKGNTLEATTAAAAKNPAYKPEVSNVAFSAKKLLVGKKYTVSYDYADGNAVEDASTFAILVADTEDAKAEDWKAIEGFTGTAADLGVKEFKFDKEQLKKFVKIEVTVVNKDEVTGEEAKVYSEVYEVKKASSGSTSLTGPNLATGGSNVPVKPEDPSTPGTDAPVVEVNKEAIVLTIDSKNVSVFGEAVENDVAPVIRNDRTMLPARIVAESLGAEVAWDEATKTVTITKGETVIVIVIDSDKATVNGEEVALDSAAFIENDRTYTPIRFIAEALGATVGWDDATKVVTITPAVVADEK